MTEFVISVLLAVAPSLFPQVEAWLYTPPDTPASDLVLLRYPYAVAKNHAFGPNARTELVNCSDRRIPWECGITFDWVRVSGVERPTVCHDAHRTALAGSWLVVQDRQGQCYTFDLAAVGKASPETDLAGVNAHLAQHGVGPVSDADFHTFEQLAEERDRQRTTRSLAVLSTITFGWLAVVGAAFWFRQRTA